jgi:sterol desaturase/sphingolipid hydroxylase (fatty acid hydroxylase superfamily)
MSYLYTRPPPTQHLLVLTQLTVAIAIGSTEAFADLWRGLVHGVPPLLLFVGGPLLLHFVVFWSLAGLFHYADTHDKPAWIVRHRIQQDQRRYPDLRRTLRVLAVNQLVLTPILLVLLAWALQARGWAISPELPSLGTLLFELTALAASALIAFYAAHRFLHRPWWLKRVHRVHHEFRTTTALASEYAHPFEFAIGNFGILAVGVLLFLPSAPSIALFTVLAITTIVVHHSGYALPWAPYALPHDWHHYRYVELFSTTGFIDRVLGTAPEFFTLKDGDRR